MSCKSDVPFNFGPASELDEIVYGAARPGAKSQRCFNTEDKVSPAEVQEWCDFIKGQGVSRVVSLLSDSEKETYQEPLLLQLQAAFKKAVYVDAKAQDAVQQVNKHLEDAANSGEKALVHCWGGGGRTGLFVAAWLCHHHHKTPEEAAALVEGHAKACGASRRVDVAALRQALGL